MIEEEGQLEGMADRIRAGMEDSKDNEPDLEADATPKPKRRSPKRRARARAPRASSTKPPSLRAPLQAMLETVGGVWHMSELTRGGHVMLDESFPTCGSVLVAQAPSIATNLNTLAASDPNVYRWLDRMMAGGGWGGVVLACWPVAQSVLAAHVMPAMQRRRELAGEVVEPAPWEGIGEDGDTSPA